MKTQILTTLLATLAITSTANARVLSVELDKQESNADRTVYVASEEACPGTFQSVFTTVTKIAADAAIVDLKPALDVTKCAQAQIVDVRFFILIDTDLKAQGLDPKTAKIYFELQ